MGVSGGKGEVIGALARTEIPVGLSAPTERSSLSLSDSLFAAAEHGAEYPDIR